MPAKNSRQTHPAREPSKPAVADEIARLADRGEDISHSFTGNGKMMPPILPAAQ
jgi:hypothetical protein